MIKEMIKKSFLWKIKSWLFETIYFPAHINLKSKIRNSNDYILLIGTPLFDNLGDHLIAIKENEWLKDHYPEKKVIEIPTPVFFRYEKFLFQNVKDDIEVFITGGGWMGDIWPDDEKKMQRMIKCFCNNRIIVFPQTVFYELKNDSDRDILRCAKETYLCCKSLTLCFRDVQSFDFAINNFSGVNVDIKLLPDMALYNVEQDNTQKEKKLGICLRRDREKNRTMELENIVHKWAIDNNYICFNYSTITKVYIPIWIRTYLVNRLINKLRFAEIIVTDRLHGVIMAYWAGCKCIAIDNKTHKVAGVYNKWLYKNRNIQLLRSDADIYELSGLLDVYKKEENNMEMVFENLDKNFNIV